MLRKKLWVPLRKNGCGRMKSRRKRKEDESSKNEQRKEEGRKEMLRLDKQEYARRQGKNNFNNGKTLRNGGKWLK